MNRFQPAIKAICVFSILCLWVQTSYGFRVGHNETDLSVIPDDYITAAKNNLDVVYQHTSHGSQIVTGIRAVAGYYTDAVHGRSYPWTDPNGDPGTTGELSLDDYGIRPGVYYCLSTGDSEVQIQAENSEDPDFNVADWAIRTRDYLIDTDNYHINVVMWSWCNIGGHDIDLYLRSMEWLIAQFSEGGSTYTDEYMLTAFSPHARAATNPVRFVFITGHANGGGENDSSDSRNRIIRKHCSPANWDRILYDFADIENYDPDGNYFLDKLVNDALYYDSDGDGSRDTYWSSEYLARHNGEENYELTKGDGASHSGCGSCSHSEGSNGDSRLNCVLKGKAAWHLFARLAGWEGASVPGDMDGDGAVTTADVIVGLKAMSGENIAVDQDGDADWDGIIGFDDILFLLERLGGN